MTAAEKAMAAIGAALESYYRGNVTVEATLNAVAFATGAYSVERTEGGK